MTVSAAQLLKQLEPAVRPSAAPVMRLGAEPAASDLSFDQLLKAAANGEIHSGCQITIDCEIEQVLDATQLERLASAADRAEACGARQAVMLIDGRAFVMDVKLRSLTAELCDRHAFDVIQVDAAVQVAGSTHAHTVDRMHEVTRLLSSA